MRELKITMLGATGVGKTSLLAAIYDQFQDNLGRANFQLTPDGASGAKLEERLKELQNLPDRFETKGWTPRTQGSKSYTFELGKKGANPSLKLHFVDYPGEWHESKASDENQKKVEDFLRESVAVIIAIDTPALMEKPEGKDKIGKWHKEVNTIAAIKELFERVYRNLSSPKLVILAPVRCEKYVQDEKKAAELLRRVKDGYSNLINHFSSETLLTKVAVVVTPVQTVGNVWFSRIDKDENGKPKFMFTKTRDKTKYSPKDSEQPLRYLLRFLLKLHIREREWGMFNFLRDFFSLDNDLKNAISEFAKGCKNTDGFAVLQGESLLNM